MMAEGAAFKFACPSCKRTFQAKAELAGRRIKCKCGHVMTVPDPGQAKAASGSPASPSAKGAPGAAQKAANKCPSCGAELAGGAVICIQCGFNLKTGSKMQVEAGVDEVEEEEAPARPQAPSAEMMARLQRHKKTRDDPTGRRSGKGDPSKIKNARTLCVLLLIWAAFDLVYGLVTGQLAFLGTQAAVMTAPAIVTLFVVAGPPSAKGLRIAAIVLNILLIAAGVGQLVYLGVQVLFQGVMFELTMIRFILEYLIWIMAAGVSISAVREAATVPPQAPAPAGAGATPAARRAAPSSTPRASAGGGLATFFLITKIANGVLIALGALLIISNACIGIFLMFLLGGTAYFVITVLNEAPSTVGKQVGAYIMSGFVIAFSLMVVLGSLMVLNADVSELPAQGRQVMADLRDAMILVMTVFSIVIAIGAVNIFAVVTASRVR